MNITCLTVGAALLAAACGRTSKDPIPPAAPRLANAYQPPLENLATSVVDGPEPTMCRPDPLIVCEPWRHVAAAAASALARPPAPLRGLEIFAVSWEDSVTTCFLGLRTDEGWFNQELAICNEVNPPIEFVVDEVSYPEQGWLVIRFSISTSTHGDVDMVEPDGSRVVSIYESSYAMVCSAAAGSPPACTEPIATHGFQTDDVRWKREVELLPDGRLRVEAASPEADEYPVLWLGGDDDSAGPDPSVAHLYQIVVEATDPE